MTRYTGHDSFRHDTPGRAGVLLVNLGSPEAPTPAAVRRYLSQFLGDPRVVEIPRLPWWLILHAVVLRTRPKKSAHAYRQVWREDGSPLHVLSARLRDGVQRALAERMPGPVSVELAMTYGEPSVSSALARLREQAMHRLLVLPLFPQYSGTTTGAVFDAVSRELMRWRRVPALRMVDAFHDDSGYLGALEQSVRQAWGESPAGQRLVMSFHGLPARNLELGDPYHCQCQATARLLAGRLGLDEDRWQVTFQSRFGRAEWLRPYTDETLRALPSAGVREVDVMCPGFSVDCLETLEEIDQQNREFFLEAGGTRFRYIPCLNDDPAHAEALAGLAQRHLAGWPEADPAYDDDAARAQAQASARRAAALGAKR